MQNTTKAEPSEVRLAIRSLAAIGGLLVMVVILVVTAIALVGQYQLALAHRQGRCLMDQLIEHRASSVTHEAQSAIEHHDAFEQPAGVQPPSEAAVEAARRHLPQDCAPFLPKGIENPEPVYVPSVVTTVPSTSTTSTSSTMTPAVHHTVPHRRTTSTARRVPATSRTTAKPHPSSTTTTTRPTTPPTTSCPVPFTPCPIGVSQ